MGTETLTNAPTEATVSSYRILDPKFRDNAWQYVYQCVMAMMSTFAVLMLLDVVTQTTLVASLGASSFIAFTMPHVESSRPRYLVGGYGVGTLVGCGVSLLADAIAGVTVLDFASFDILCGSVAVGIAIFLMVITDTEHPPAAALALGFAFTDWTGLTVAVVLGGAVAISVIKELSKSIMIDLL